jgi:hypothetical protein
LSDSEHEAVNWINPAAERRAAAKKPVSEHAPFLQTMGLLAPHMNKDELMKRLSDVDFNVDQAHDSLLSSKPAAKGATATKKRPRS